MEQEQQNENLDSTPPKNSVFAFFDTIRLKHIILFLLCLLFLGVLIGGGSNERPAKRLAIKNKKCKTDKKNSSIKGKDKVAGSIENLAINSKDKVSEIGNKLKEKTGKAIESTNNSLKQRKEKIEDAVENTSTKVKKGTEKIGEIITGKNANVESSKQLKQKLDKATPKVNDKNSNALFKGLSAERTEIKERKTTDDKVVVKEEVKDKQKQVDAALSNNNKKGLKDKTLENEISLLKKEVDQLKNRIDQLNTASNTQNETSSLSNDVDFIDKRIKFWQSVKEMQKIKK